MNRISYEIFKEDAEITFFEGASDEIAEFSFSEVEEGLLSIGGIVARVSGGKCRLDLRLIENGSYEPVLILQSKVVRLPRITKSGRKLKPFECTDEFVRSISLRERRLALRVVALEKELKELSSKIYDTTIL